MVAEVTTARAFRFLEFLQCVLRPSWVNLASQSVEARSTGEKSRFHSLTRIGNSQ